VPSSTLAADVQGALALATFGGFGWAVGACWRGVLWHFWAFVRPSAEWRLYWIEKVMEHPPTTAKDAARGLLIGSAVGIEALLLYVLKLT
jgi:hypothetical protein